MKDPIHEIKDVENPNYLEHLYPKEGLPKFGWDAPPGDMPREVWLTETTHRDGQQGGLPLSSKTSLEVYDIICRFTGESRLIRQAEFFAYSEQDRASLEGAVSRFRDGAPIEPTTWIRATRKDVELIREIGVKETGMLASASDYHLFHKFHQGGRKAGSVQYLEALEACLDLGIRPRLHLEDATRADPAFIQNFIEASETIASRYEESLSPKIRICDTMGLGLPFENIPAPRGIPKLIKLVRDAGVASENLEFHPHNDTWMIMANCLAAIMAGCSAINGTCLGKGERTGNAPLEAVALHLVGMGLVDERGIDFTALNRLVELYQLFDQPIADKYPLFGRDAHRTRAGIHADGLNKMWRMYAPFNVPEILGRPLEVSITKDSGLAGIQFLIKQHTGQLLEKGHPEIKAASQWIQIQFDSGRQTAIEWEEISSQLNLKNLVS